MTQKTAFDREVDCYGLWCPMPIVKASEEMARMADGAILKIVSTDDAAEEDFRAWSRKTGNTFLECTRNNELLEIYVKKGP